MIIKHRYISKLFALILICSVCYSGLSFSEGVEDWIQWRDGYLRQVGKIQATMLIINEGAKNGDDHKNALLVGKYSSEKAISELEALEVPPELQPYHQKLKEGYNLLIQQVDALLSGDVQAAENFSLKVVKAEQESFTELRRVAEQHGAPKEDLDSMDKCLSFFPKY